MNLNAATHLVYLAVAVPLTVWLARTIHRHGRLFLVDVFKGNEALADAVNSLLVIGFCLINVGFVAQYAATDRKVEDYADLLSIVTTKLGVAMAALGGIHLVNVFVLGQVRSSANKSAAKPAAPLYTYEQQANPYAGYYPAPQPQ